MSTAEDRARSERIRKRLRESGLYPQLAKCPRGGTHVFPHQGKPYDDGRCLKCGKAKA